MRKFTKEYVENFFIEQGCELIDTYINASTPVRFKCSCGEVSKIRFDTFKNRGQRCKKCGIAKMSESQSHDFDFVFNFFTNEGYTIISNNYKNSHTKLTYKCPKGHLGNVSFDLFKNKGTRCSMCANKIRADKTRLKLDQVKERFLQHGINLIGNYERNTLPVLCICKCGKEAMLSLSNVEKGQLCMDCGTLKRSENRRFTFEEVRNYFSDIGYHLMDDAYVNDATPLRYKCSEGHTSTIRFNNLRQGARCGYCAVEKNKGENHYKYNHDLTKEDRLIARKYEEYFEWRKNVLKRDKYMCVCCGYKGKELIAHHVLNYATNKELRTVVSNGVTLCKICHIEFHSMYGNADNNKEQLDEFIKTKAIRKSS